MRLLLLILATLLPFSPLAAPAPAEAARFKQWIEPGWKLLRVAQGDLNHDGLSDAVLVVEQDDPANRRRNEGLGAPALNLNPRRLLVLFGNDAGYRPAARADRFLPSENSADAPCLDDPLEEGGIQVSRQVLKVELHYWLSCGSYGVSHAAWSFRYEAGRFRLIGFDRWEFMRNSGERSESSTNFLTGRRRTTTGLNEFAERSRPSISWKTLAGRKTFFLDEMTSECLDGGKAQPWCE